MLVQNVMSTRMRKAGHVTRTRNSYITLVGKTARRDPLGRQRTRPLTLKNSSTTKLKGKIIREDVNSGYDKMVGPFEDGNEPSSSVTRRKFVQLKDYPYRTTDSAVRG